MAADNILDRDISGTSSDANRDVSKDDDVIIRGNIIEFLNGKKCEACRSRERDCIIKFNANSCLLCSDAGRSCIFERQMRVRGLASRFNWASLLTKEGFFDLDQDVPAADKLLNHASAPTLDLTSKSRNTLVNEWPLIPDLDSHGHDRQQSIAPTISEKTLSGSTHVFDKDMSPVRGKRNFSELEKQRIASVRKQGACIECRSKKRKCTHTSSLLHDREDDAINNTVLSPRTPLIQPLIQEPGPWMVSNPGSSISAPLQDQIIGSSSKSPGAPQPSSIKISIPKVSYIRPPMSKIMCPKCDHYPSGFRGKHELERHIRREHPAQITKWKCVDASKDGQFLDGCTACREGKLYGAYYNAAAHLRRKHFNPKERGGKRRGGSGGEDPPMEILKGYMQEVVVDNERAHHNDWDEGEDNEPEDYVHTEEATGPAMTTG